ncbi:hypothetical protein NEDG_01112 [Nematocida displodere]|uniref:Uncharacterized protein n=1 Tax=Nematocida displodere TaxID=1805483 RepID=A0A177EAK7_9MICR|nr:hypothetical protein NEDG_01112 [Nematocida displodere]
MSPLLNTLLSSLAHQIISSELAITLTSSGKIKKRKGGMVKVLCKSCSTSVNSMVFTKHLERCSHNQN